MRIGVSTLPYHKLNVVEAADHLVEKGFHLIEILCEEPHAHPDDLLGSRQLEVLKQMTRDQGVQWLIHAPVADVNFMSPNRSMRCEAKRQLGQTILLARELGCGRIVFHVGGRPRMGLYDQEKGFRDAVEVIGSLLKEAARYGIGLLLENDPVVAGLSATTPEACGELIRAFDGELGFLLDVGHANMVDNETGLRFIRELGPFLQGVHINDNRGSVDEHLGMGRGTVNMAQVMAALQGISFQGEIILELLDPRDLIPGKTIIDGLMK